ncbi:hypothetical protein MY494_07625 [Synechococcus sp. A10-1-5-1]|uniref:hypothetical protein n=1 Tax=Synechococcus sp. A10-1-5-1 TaxID=2936507 RepID=UPI002000F1D9|nr:hypothetical protein [Synechococcus sp. A10-1-5-1]UPM49222.1 hypothetical protein MY494_07625 [Synechococcus sp. A10-1-5-1]
MIPKAWDRRLYWWAVGLYVVLAVAALASGVTSWDEETDYLGIRTQIAHAAQMLHGDSPDYRNIHSNLEYYGVVGLLPAWIFWFLQQSLLVGRLTLPQALFYPAAEHQLTGFYFTSHLLLAAEFLGLSWLVTAIARELGARFPWLAGCLTLLTPSLLGHSFVNPKDIPFALFYTAFTFTLLRRYRSTDVRWFGWSVFASGLLINQKFVAIVPVLLTELLLFGLKPPAGRSLWRSVCVPSAGLLLALLLQPASWGLWPWVYLREAFDTFARHEWGGCMWWGGSCIGINQPGWLTLRYLWNWWSIKWPLLLILLVALQTAWCFHRLRRDPKSLRLGTPWWLLLSQAALVPGMAALRQSNLYDADRHTLFVYPALAVVAAFGFQRLWQWQGPLLLRRALLALAAALAFVLVLDDLALNPYQSAYLNEWGRLRHDHKTTALDYWAVSAKESLRQAQLNGNLPLSPTVDDSVGPLPLFIGYRQLAGHVEMDASPRLKLQVRDVPAFSTLEGCTHASEVSRTLSTGHRLVMSRLWSCP